MQAICSVARLRDAEYREAQQRLVIGDQTAVGAGNQNVAYLVAIADADLLDAWVMGPGGAVGSVCELLLFLQFSLGRGGSHGIEVVRRAGGGQTDRVNLRRAVGDMTGDAGRFSDAFRREVVGVGIAGLVARNHSHAAPNQDPLGSILDDRFIEQKGRCGGVFKIEIRVIAPGAQRFTEIAFQVFFNQTVGVEKETFKCRHRGWQISLRLQFPRCWGAL